MKKCWCIPPEHNAVFVAAMEDVLEVYSRPYDEAYPVVCMDEKPVQFFADFRTGFRSRKDGVVYEDYQYIRNGTACIFLFTEPLAGWRYADAQERRTRQDWARQIEWLLTEQYPTAKKVILVMDNLNTHSVASLYATFPPQRARQLAERLEIHYTPKHGSWLDIAEIELSAGLPFMKTVVSKSFLCLHSHLELRLKMDSMGWITIYLLIIVYQTTT